MVFTADINNFLVPSGTRAESASSRLPKCLRGLKFSMSEMKNAEILSKFEVTKT